MDYEDPGWKHAVRTALIRGTVVGLLWRRARLSATPSALIRLRLIFLSMALSVWLILFVLSFIAPYAGTDSLPAWAVAVIVLGCFSAWRIRALEDRLVRARSDVELMVRFRSIFFIQLGLAQFPSFVSFVGSFLASTALVYLLGAVVTTIDLWLMAPSRWNVIRIQERLNEAGVPASLGRILTTGGQSQNV